MKNIKDKIAAGFSKAAGQYEQFAQVQHRSAVVLRKTLAGFKDQLPTGPVLEVGCGAGNLSRLLAIELPDRDLLLTDFAAGMLAQCRKNLDGLPNLQRVAWQLMDGEMISEHDKFSLIISGLTLQWFDRPDLALERAGRALKKGGRLLYSYVGLESFPEWRAICRSLQLPCTANRLPDWDMILTGIKRSLSEIETWSENVTITYSGAKDFFHSFKKTGSSTSLNGGALGLSEMRRLLREWDASLDGKPLEVTYCVHYLMAVQ